MNLKEVFRDAPIIYVLIALGGLLGYFLRLILARNLSVVDYGLFYAVYAFVFFFSPFKILGLQEAQVFFINKNRKKFSYVKSVFFTTLGIQFLASSIIAILIILFSGFLAENYFKNSAASTLLILLAIVFVLDTFFLHFLSFFAANQKIKFLAIGDFLKTFFIMILVLILFEILYSNVLVPGYAYVLGYLIVVLIFLFMMLRKFKYIFLSTLDVNKVLTKKIINYAIPIMLAIGGTILLTSTDTLLLTYFTGLEFVGLYNIALPIIAMLALFSTPISTILFPKISELYHAKKSKDISEVLNVIYNNYLIIALPLCLSLFFYSDAVIILLFGSKFLGATIVLKIFSAFFVFMSLKDINFAVIAGIGKPKETSKIIYIAAGFNLIANIILIPFFGIVGAASTTVASFLIMFFLSFRVLKKNYSLTFDYVQQSKIFLSSLLFLLSIFLLQRIILISNSYMKSAIILAISFIAYFLLLFLIGVLNKNKILLVKKMIFN